MNQLPLQLVDYDRAVMGAARVRRECRTVAEEIGPKELAAAWGTTEKIVLLKCDQRDRHYLKPEELADLMLRDRHMRILGVLNDVAGCEPPERKRVLEPGEKLARLDSTLDEMFGADVAELVRRKAGLL
jgi:hypothetical protein